MQVSRYAFPLAGLEVSDSSGCPYLKQEAVDVLKRRRTGPMGVPLSDPAVDKELFAQLIAETDASIGKIDAFLDANGLLDVDAPRRGTHVHEVDSRVVLDVFATSVLPYDWHFASCGVWNFYKGAQKHFGPVFGKKAQVGNERSLSC